MDEQEIANKSGSRARLKRITEEMERGLRFVETFDEMRVVTFYGSSRAKPEDSWYVQAYDLGKKLAEDDNSIAVCTGGGPGVMEAGNKGAREGSGISIGLGIDLSNISEEPNPYPTHRMDFYYFFARKMALVHIAQGYVFFPGGVGTMDEFFEVVTLISTEKIEDRPVMVLVGVEYWTGLLAWMRETMSQRYHAFSESFLDRFLLTDDMDEAYRLLDTIPSRLEISDKV